MGGGWIFSALERRSIGCGWFWPVELWEKGTTVDDMYPLVVPTKAHINLIGEIVHVPGNLWPVEDSWWKADKYEESLQQLSAEEISGGVVFIKKVALRMQRYVQVMLMSNLREDEMVDLQREDTYHFLQDKSILFHWKKSRMKGTAARVPERGGGV